MSNFQLPPYQVNDSNPFLSLSQGVDWGPRMLKIEEIHKTLKVTGKHIKVGVVDTGAKHKDIEAAIPYSNYDTLLNATNEVFSAKNGHGSGVCGVVGARNNEIGTLSYAPDCVLLPVKGMRESGSGILREIISAGYLAAEHGANIVNFSLGTRSNNPQFHKMIKDLRAQGIYVVCAAGNTGQEDDVNYPAAYEESIAVGAINSRGETSAFSSRGWEIEVGAPGEKVLTPWKNEGYATVSGTSFAAPAVAGMLALFLEAQIQLTNEMLKNTSIDIDDPGQDVKSGYGIINPYTIIEQSLIPPASSSATAPSSSIEVPNEDFAKALLAYDSLKEFLIQNGVL